MAPSNGFFPPMNSLASKPASRSSMHLRIGGAIAALAVLAADASGEEAYPSRPVQVIVPFSAGGNSDLMARPFLDALGKSLAGTFVVVNREGAGGTIGFGGLATAKPDGHTLGFGPTSPMTNAPHMMKKLAFGFDDFEYVCHVFENVLSVAVAPTSKITSLNNLVELARKAPGKLTYGTAGVASLPHLTGEGFAQRAGIQVTHVPFRGDGQVIPQVLGGQVDFSISGVGSATENLRALAVFSDTRNAAVPDVPTAVELGLPSMPPGYQGLFAPKGTPSGILTTLQKGCRAVVESEDFRSYARRAHQTLRYLDGAAFTQRAREDYDFKGKLIRNLNLGGQ